MTERRSTPRRSSLWAGPLCRARWRTATWTSHYGRVVAEYCNQATPPTHRAHSRNPAWSHSNRAGPAPPLQPGANPDTITSVRRVRPHPLLSGHTPAWPRPTLPQAPLSWPRPRVTTPPRRQSSPAHCCVRPPPGPYNPWYLFARRRSAALLPSGTRGGPLR